MTMRRTNTFDMKPGKEEEGEVIHLYYAILAQVTHPALKGEA